MHDARGFTLLESSLSLIVTAVIGLALTSSMVLVARAIEHVATAQARTRTGSASLDVTHRPSLVTSPAAGFIASDSGPLTRGRLERVID